MSFAQYGSLKACAIRLRLSWALCLLPVVAAVFPAQAIAEPPDTSLTEAQRSNATLALANWFECADCDQGELEVVTRYGRHVVPGLAATLDEGPSAASREILRRSLEELYDALVEQARERPNMKPRSSREEFVARYLAGFDVRYRVRAATALARIGGADARAVLETALPRAEYPKVRAAIKRSLKQVR